jgi:endonuclease/exonuclease/phosphatase (EEP) superfamily protein YafD
LIRKDRPVSLKLFFSFTLAILSVIWIGLGLVCLIDSARPKLYIIDIFTLPILISCIVWLLLMLLLRQGPASLITGAALLMLAGAHLPQALPPRPQPDMAATPIKVLFHNLWYKNLSAAGLLKVINKENPDVVALIEVSSSAEAGLIEGLGQRYPYQDFHYDRLIFSKFPLKNVAYAKKLNATHARVKTPDGDIHLIAVHLTRPWPFKRGSQIAQVERLEDFMQPYDNETTLVVGDFNSTPSAALLRGLAKRQALNTAPALTGTWPNYLPGFARLGIDNGLAGGALRFNDRHVGDYTGSDHLPVIFVLTRAKKADAN